MQVFISIDKKIHVFDLWLKYSNWRKAAKVFSYQLWELSVKGDKETFNSLCIRVLDFYYLSHQSYPWSRDQV